MAVSAGHLQRGKLYLAFAIAPAFAAVRYAASKHNKHHPSLPRWTLLCNMVACALATGCSVSPTSDHAQLTGVALGALSLGGAGCLSTVSTFANEVRLLPALHAVVYATLTLVLGQCISVPIIVCLR